MKKLFIARMLLKQYKDENFSLLPGKLAEGLNILKIKKCNATFPSAFNEEINVMGRKVGLQTRSTGWKTGAIHSDDNKPRLSLLFIVSVNIIF